MQINSILSVSGDGNPVGGLRGASRDDQDLLSDERLGSSRPKTDLDVENMVRFVSVHLPTKDFGRLKR